MKNIYSGSTGSHPSNFYSFGDTLLFRASNSAAGIELWKTDGTNAGTVLVEDINPGSGGSNPMDFATFGDTAYFQANGGSAINYEIFKTNGTTEGTALAGELVPGASGSFPEQLVVLGNKLVFVANTAATGTEIFVMPLNSSVLPIALSQFNVNCDKKGNRLAWQTLIETGSDHFEIEKSDNSRDWTNIGHIKSSNGSARLMNYEFVDATGGRAFYRLKNFDQDGSFTYSSIVSINCSAKQPNLYVYPVPAKGTLTIILPSDKNGTVTLQVMDLTGRKHLQERVSIQKGSNNIKLNIGRLVSAEYYLKIIEAGNVRTLKIMVAN